MTKSPDEWKYAPILVATNLERVTISRCKIKQWAIDNKTYVFKWKCLTARHINHPSAEAMQDILDKNAFFWQFWAPGVSSYLDNNINGDLALVNGAPVTMHSLTFDDPQKYQAILDEIEELRDSQGNPLPFGSEIEIEEPLAVNVVMEKSLDGKPLSRKRKLQMEKLAQFSAAYGIDNDHNSDKIILPLTTDMRKKSYSSTDQYSYCTGNFLVPVASVYVREPFPYDLAFSMTVHKAQGRTIYRVVIDLTDHPNSRSRMKYASIFVAMSRVRQRSHIRLLEKDPHLERHEAYEYLAQIKPDKYAAAFFHGFTEDPNSEDGDTWDPEKSLMYSRTS